MKTPVCDIHSIRDRVHEPRKESRLFHEWPNKREITTKVEGSARGSDRFMFPYMRSIWASRGETGLRHFGLCLFCPNTSKSPNIWSYPDDSCKHGECRPCVDRISILCGPASIRSPCLSLCSLHGQSEMPHSCRFTRHEAARKRNVTQHRTDWHSDNVRMSR